MTTKIEWVQNPDGTKGETWNPVRGCTRVSKGCEHCYAETQAHRFSGPGQAYEGLTLLRQGSGGQAGGPVWTGKIRLVPEALEKPLRWRKPRKVFVNSMSDLFHDGVPIRFIAEVFNVMASWRRVCRKKDCEHDDFECFKPNPHTFQILTKRPKRMLEVLRRGGELDDEVGEYWPGDSPLSLAMGESESWPLPNVWLGVSVEDQATADERLPLLLEVPAAVRFVSYEPALGEVDFTRIWPRRLDKHINALAPIVPDEPPALDWVICGGESGPGARPMHPDWARQVRDQCEEAGVPFFFKQGSQANWKNFKDFDSFPRDLQIREFPESSDGR